jgi:ribonuclease Z
MFQLCILGSSSATPAFKRHLSAQVVWHNDRIFLIDCGEGTQFQLLRYHIRLPRLDAIFISHLHGDHFFGLVGLLCTMNNQERTRPLNVYAPAGLKDILYLQFKASDTKMRFDLNIHELTSKVSEKIFENSGLEVSTLPLKHRVYCNGFLFQEKARLGRLNAIKAQEAGVPSSYYRWLKQGMPVTRDDGKVFLPENFIEPAKPSFSYAYCSDNRYHESLFPLIQSVSVLYHESTFMEEMKAKAETTEHSTAGEAAKTALAVGAGQLILGHFSARYPDLAPLLAEARAIFPNSYLAEEGKIIDLTQPFSNA